MNQKALICGVWSLSVSGVVFLSGCATPTLWSETDYKGPSTQHGMSLFESTEPPDLLVVYYEVSDRNGEVRKRAYFLNQYEQATSRKPAFVSPRLARSLPPVPVFREEAAGDNSTNVGLHALMATNGIDFSVWSDTRKLASYSLPEYPDGWDRTKKVALTPLAVIVDAVLVASIVGLVVGLAYLNSESAWAGY